MAKTAYAAAGVNLEVSNSLKSGLGRLLSAASRPEVLGKVGGFGGLFVLKSGKYKQPVLVSSVDGVGTKLKVAFAMNRHHTIGQDLVNHCVDDITVLGAEPLFFLDYLGTGELKPNVFEEIVAGFAQALEANVAIEQEPDRLGVLVRRLHVPRAIFLTKVVHLELLLRE